MHPGCGTPRSAPEVSWELGPARLQEVPAELVDGDLDELCDQLLTRSVPAEPDDDVAVIAARLVPQDRTDPGVRR